MQFNGFEEQKVNRHYTRKEVIEMLYATLPPAPIFCRNKEIDNKYLSLAVEQKYNTYRVGTLADIYNLGLMSSFTENQKEFFNTSGEFLVIFNTLNDKPTSIVFRGLKQKTFLDYSVFPSLYGLDHINPEFKYGDWLLLCEGSFDVDSFRHIHKDGVALLTSSITVMQSEILNTLTNRFIIGFDSDLGGQKGTAKSIQRLKQVNNLCTIKKLSIYGNDKDLGIMQEVKENPTEYNRRVEYYQNLLDSIKGVVK